MSGFVVRSVRATLFLSLGVVLVVTPGGVPQSVAHPSAALSAHVAAAVPAGPAKPVPATAFPAPRTAVAPRVNQDPALSLAALSWSQPHVNALTETATDVLTWTVDDAANVTSFTDLSGTLQIGLQPAPGGHTPTRYSVAFAGHVAGTTATGTIYRYTFPVPVWAAAAVGTWAVTSMSMTSVAHGTLNLTADQLAAGYPSTFTADSAVDTTAPALAGVTTDPYAFDDGTEVDLRYTISVDDNGSGTALAHITVRGPGGTQVTDDSVYTPPLLGPRGDLALVVTLPTNAVGTWTVTEVDLTDTVGNFASYTGSPTPVVVTADSVLRAGDFTAGPNPVDDWTNQQTVNYTMNVVDPAAITSAALLTSTFCPQGTPTLPGAGGGAVSIPVTVPVATVSCGVKGVVLTDAAGNVSVYGAYGERTALPDIAAEKGAPPQATDLRLSTTDFGFAQRLAGPLTLTLDVSSWEPGVTFVCVGSPDLPIEHDCALNLPRLRTGTATVNLFVLAAARPGTYRLTVGVFDAAGNVATYGFGGTPVPGNPLTVTVAGSIPPGAHLSGPPHGTDGKLR